MDTFNSVLGLFDTNSKVVFHPTTTNSTNDENVLDHEYESLQDKLRKNPLCVTAQKILYGDGGLNDSTDIDKYNELCLDYYETNKKNIVAVCIDGTSAVGKSSIGKRLSCSMIKPCRGKRYIARNSHPSSCIAYFFDFMKTMIETTEFTMYDRLPINTLMWNKIWLMLAALGDEKDPSEDLLRRLFIYSDYLDPEVMRSICKLTFNIIIIDTDYKRASDRLRCRATGSDLARADWINYIKVQNYAYAMLHARWPELFYLIDLEWFHGDQTLMQDYVLHLTNKLKLHRSKTPKLFTFTPVDLYKTTIDDEPYEYSLCGDINLERARPMSDVIFTDDIKKYGFDANTLKCDARLVSFYTVDASAEYGSGPGMCAGVTYTIETESGSSSGSSSSVNTLCSTFTRSTLIATVNVVDPIHLWKELVGVSKGVLIGDILWFKTCNERLNFIRFLIG